jgi:uncharacterized protein YndB with AHSA1/START domain
MKAATQKGDAMEERSVTHSTFVIERDYPAAPERVFSAFSDPAKKRRWFQDEEQAKIAEFAMDFRVDGFDRKQFHSKEGDFTFTNNTVYRDIVPNRRIVFAYNMSVGPQVISSSLATIELLPMGEGTKLIFTEQSAFFEGADGPKSREHGWRLLLENLATFLVAS